VTLPADRTDVAVKVKVCGITNAGDARAAVDLGADAIGLNFYPRSPRRLTVAQAVEIRGGLPGTVCVVGVFVNAGREEVAAVADAVKLAALQFHGDESPAACAGWGSRVVIKALRADASDVATRAARYEVRYVLLDAPSAEYGGSGRTFDWHLAAAVPRGRLVVAGGLTPENVAEVVRLLRPAAVDVASGVETAPGRKDHGKLKAFIQAAKTA
jgi:phosphoribosylanthranilate isomerase